MRRTLTAFTVNKGLRGRIGGVLKEPYNGNVAFGQLESDVKFSNSKAVYLSREGWRQYRSAHHQYAENKTGDL
jgi:hypothetical protein